MCGHWGWQSLKGNDVVNTLERLHVLYGIRSQRIKVDNGPDFFQRDWIDGRMKINLRWIFPALGDPLIIHL